MYNIVNNDLDFSLSLEEMVLSNVICRYQLYNRKIKLVEVVKDNENNK